MNILYPIGDVYTSPKFSGHPHNLTSTGGVKRVFPQAIRPLDLTAGRPKCSPVLQILHTRQSWQWVTQTDPYTPWDFWPKLLGGLNVLPTVHDRCIVNENDAKYDAIDYVIFDTRQ